MKLANYLSLMLLVIWSCGGGDSPIDEVNLAPTQVNTLIYPTDNLLCINSDINFEWGATTDPDGDHIKYILEVSENENFTNTDIYKVSELQTTITLENNKRFYWRVQAEDSKNLKGPFSNVNKFYTEGIGSVNHLPFSPELVGPELGAVISKDTATLIWRASDVDMDALSYDVFLDTANPPLEKIAENIDVSLKNVDLNGGTTYYWKVVAKDSHGGEAVSSIWSFQTD